MKKTLCTVWQGNPDEQWLVIPGNKRQTRKTARGHFGPESKRLKAIEEMWSDAKLKALPEYDG